MGWETDPNGKAYDEGMPLSWQETKQYIVFVHGWNMSYEGSQNFAETMFKRLWQRGYKGRFGTCAGRRWMIVLLTSLIPITVVNIGRGNVAKV